jgi:serine/threonine protein phosphatase PrpC
MNKWIFKSQKGKDRETNKDFFSLVNSCDGTWLFVLDIATASNATEELAKCFIEAVVSQLKHFIFEGVDSVKAIIYQAFKVAKNKLKTGVASFLAIYRCSITDNFYSFIAGDCRIGVLIKKNSINWISPVHTGVNPLGDVFLPQMKFNNDRHTLTRSMNLRRNFNPEIFTFNLLFTNTLVLATDGFWAELDDDAQQAFISQGVANTSDDTSVLLVTWSDTKETSHFENNVKSNLSIISD